MTRQQFLTSMPADSVTVATTLRPSDEVRLLAEQLEAEGLIDLLSNGPFVLKARLTPKGVRERVRYG